MVKKILIGVAVLMVLFFSYVGLQPSDFRVTRSATLDAPVDVVFAQVNDFHNWEAWSPWAKLDPKAKTEFSGPDSGVGASFHWAGNHEVGEGIQTISESKLNERILINLDFLKPFKSNATAEFTFVPQGDQTEVSWSMSGKNNVLSRAMCVFMNMDKMVGGQFENGLTSLGEVVQAKKKA